MGQHTHDSPKHDAYAGPYLDGSKLTSMDCAWLQLRGGAPVANVCRPEPSADVVNGVLAGNTPDVVLQTALDDGSYTVPDDVRSVADAYRQWHSQHGQRTDSTETHHQRGHKQG